MRPSSIIAIILVFLLISGLSLVVIGLSEPPIIKEVSAPVKMLVYGDEKPALPQDSGPRTQPEMQPESEEGTQPERESGSEHELTFVTNPEPEDTGELEEPLVDEPEEIETEFVITGAPDKDLKIIDKNGKNIDKELTSEQGNIKVVPKKGPLKKIMFKNFELDDSTLRIDDVPENIPAPGNMSWVSVYAIDPSDLDFTSALVTVVASGNSLYKCAAWNFDSRTCTDGNWKLLRTDLVPGEDYTFTITPDDPAFGEANLAIINVQSYPELGGNWTVDFTTFGKAPLTITATNGTTWDDLDETGDLRFLEMKCGNTTLSPLWKDNQKEVFVPNFQCDETASITSKVLTAASHTLEFTFGADVEYAYNDVSVSSCQEITSSGTYVQTTDLVGTTTAIPEIQNNFMTCIKISSSDVVYDCNGYSISNTTKLGNALGIATSGAFTNVTIKNCPAINHLGQGINLYQTNDSQIINVTVYDTYTGIRMQQDSGNTFINNTVYSCSNGFFFLLTSNNTLINNTVHDCTNAGFYMESSYGGENLTSNLAYRNMLGIEVLSGAVLSPTLRFTNNTVHSNQYGFYAVNPRGTGGNDGLQVDGLVSFNNSNTEMRILALAGYAQADLNMSGVLIKNPQGTMENHTLISFTDSSENSALNGYDIRWAPQPGGLLPTDKSSFGGKFINITTDGSFTLNDNITSMSWHWTDNESAGHNESTFQLWKHNGTWSQVSATLDTGADTLLVTSLDPASIYGILEGSASNGTGGTTVSSCQEITAPGFYALEADLTGAPFSVDGGYSACIIINASNVTLDCAGYNISNNGTSNAIGIFSNVTDNLDVRNCHVQDYMNGMYLIAVSNSHFENNTAYNNSNIGFYMHSGVVDSEYNSFINNTAELNDIRGFLLSDSNHLTVENNTISGSGSGMELSSTSYCNVSGNDISDIVSLGLYLHSSSIGNTFTGNSFHASGTGVLVDSSTFNTFTADRIYGNGIGFRPVNSDPISMAVNFTEVLFLPSSGALENYTVLSLDDAVAQGQWYDINWTSNQASLPSNLTSFNQKYVEITPQNGSPVLESVTWHWNSSEASGYNESNLQLWKYSSSWNNANAALNITGRTLKLTNHNPASTYGIFENNETFNPLSTCSEISSSGNYRLTNDLTGAPFSVDGGYSACIIINASNVTLDCAGYNISNNGTSNSIGIFSNVTDNLDVRNCHVQDYMNGMYLIAVSNSHFENNTAYNNSNIGFYMHSGVVDSEYNSFINNTAELNDIRGFLLSDSNHLTVENNTISGSGSGMELSSTSYCNVSGNDISDIVSLGLYLHSSSIGNTFTGNSFHASGTGVLVDSSTFNTFTADRIYGNGIGFRPVNSDPISMAVNFTEVLFLPSSGALENYTVLSLDDAVAQGQWYDINWTSNQASLPSNLTSFNQKYVEITPQNGSPVLESVTWHWNSSEASGYNESNLQLWKYSSSWNNANAALNITGRTLKLTNHNPASTYGIFENNETFNPLSTCSEISSSGNYRLTNDLTGAPFSVDGGYSACIIINASNVTLDCAGYNISNNGTSNSIGIFSNVTDNLDVRNCHVQDYMNGMYLIAVSNSHFENNTAYNNSNIGFYMHSGVVDSEYNSFINNTAELNDIRGFLLSDSNHLTVENNTISGSGSGMELSSTSYCNVSGNDISDIVSLGLYLHSSSIGNTFTGNSFHASGTGVLVDSSTFNTFTADRIYGNGIGFRPVNSDPISMAVNFTEVLFLPSSGALENYTVLSLDDAVAQGQWYDINWTSNQASLPSNLTSFNQKYVEITPQNGSPVLESVTWHWDQQEVIDGNYTESAFELWKDGGTWSQESATLDTNANTLTLGNLNPASTYGILQYNVTPPTAITVCQEINSPGNYILSNNLVGAPVSQGVNNVCLLISSSDVNLNCDGYNITDTGTSVSYGITVNGTSLKNYSNISISNCGLISDYSRSGIQAYYMVDGIISNTAASNNSRFGIYLYQSNSVTLENNEVYDNAMGYYVLESPYVNIFDSRVFNNTEHGMRIRRGSNMANIINNSVYGNSWTGMYVDDLNDNLIANNTVYDNSQDGIYVLVADSNMLDNNTVYGNGWNGIVLLGSDSNMLDNNTVYGNGWNGIALVTNGPVGSNHLLTNNTLHTNTQSGLYISDDNTTCTENVIHSNGVGIALFRGNSMFGSGNPDNSSLIRNALYNNTFDIFVSNQEGNDFSYTIDSNLFLNPSGTTENSTVLSMVDTMNGFSQYSMEWTAQPAALPADHVSFENSYLNITHQSGAVRIDNVSFLWDEQDVIDGNYTETQFELWKHNTSHNWTNTGAAIDTSANSLTLIDMFPTSTYSIMESTSNATFLDGCQNITSPGNYAMNADLEGAPITYVAAEICVFIQSSDVSLDCDGFSIANNGTAGFTIGIYLSDDLDNINVMNCDISDYSRGIDVGVNVNNTYIRDNTIHNNSDTGISLGTSNNYYAIIENNVVYNNTDGIDLGSAKYSNLTANHGHHNDISFKNTGAVSTGNILFNNTANDDATAGFYFVNPQNQQLINNIAYNCGDGFYVSTLNITLTNNTAYNNSGDGISLDGNYNSAFLNNTVYDNDFGIYAVNSVGNDILGNQVHNHSQTGIRLSGSNNTLVSLNNVSSAGTGILVDLDSLYNNVTWNTVDDNAIGIGIPGSNYSIVANNNVANNSLWGFVLGNSHHSVVDDNVALDNNISFYVSNSSQNNFTDNEASYSLDYGFYVTLGSSANNFIFNDVHHSTNGGFHISLLSNDNLLQDNSVYNNDEGIKLDSSNTNALINNTAHSNVKGIGIVSGADDTNLVDNSFYNNEYDFYLSTTSSTYNMSNSLFKPPSGVLDEYTNLSIDDSTGLEDYYINYSSSPAPVPSGRKSFAQKFIEITNGTGTTVSIDSIVWHWTEQEVIDGSYKESQFELWKHNGSWSDTGAALDASANTLSLSNHNPSSVYGILESNESNCMLIESPGEYALKTDISGAPIGAPEVSYVNYACIKIASSDVVFDCNGSSIINDGTSPAAGILVNGSTSVNYTNITIKNCPNVSSYNRGIYIFRSSEAEIRNTTSQNNSNAGYYLYDSSYVNLTDNFAYDNVNYGFWSYYGSYNNYIDNTASDSDNYYGFYVEATSTAIPCQNNTFIGNTAANSGRDGFNMRGISGFTPNNVNNTFINNSAIFNGLDASGYSGFYFDNSGHSLIENNTANLNSGHGFRLNAKFNDVINNTAYDNNYDGFDVGSENNYVSNTAYNNRHGFNIDSDADSNLTNNTAFNNTVNGFRVAEDDGNRLVNNTAYANHERGFFITFASATLINNTAYDNDFEGFILLGYGYDSNLIANEAYNNSRHGFHLFDNSNGNNLTDNFAHDNNWTGFSVEASDDNLFEGNQAYNNSWYGFYVWADSQGTTIRNGQALGNSKGVYVRDSDYTNLYNLEAEGNAGNGYEIYNSSHSTVTECRANNNTNIGFGIDRLTNITLTNITSFNNSYALILIDANTSLDNGHFYDSRLYDMDVYAYNGPVSVFLSDVKFDNPAGGFQNYTTLTIEDNMTINDYVRMRWTSNSSTLPSGYTSFANKYLEIVNESVNLSLDYVTWTWDQQEVSDDYNEAYFELWKDDGSWSPVSATLDTNANSLIVPGLNPASDYAILEGSGFYNLTDCALISSPGHYTMQADLVGAPVDTSPIFGSAKACILIDSSNVSLNCNGYNITNNGTFAYGILLNDSVTNVTVSDCPNIANYETGLYAYQANDSLFDGVAAFNSSAHGIFLYKSHNNNMTYCNVETITAGVDALLLSGSDSNRLIGNTVTSGTSSINAIHIAGLSSHNTLIDNTVYGSENGFSLTTGDNNALINNTARDNEWGLFIIESDDVNVTNLHLYNNSYEDFRAQTTSTPISLFITNMTLDNDAGGFVNHTSLDIYDIFGTNDQYALNWTTNPYTLPTGYVSFAQKYVDITNYSVAPSIDSIAFRWEDAELGSIYNESKFELWSYNAEDLWTLRNDTPSLANVLTLSNHNPGSTYAILQDNRSFDISSCTVIDISGEYQLLANLSGAPNTVIGGTACMVIDSPDVILDCDGHSISHDGSAGTYGVYVNESLDNVTVKNCEVSGYGYGALSRMSDSHWDTNTFNGNAYGLYLWGSSNTMTTSGVTYYNNSIYDLDLYTSAASNFSILNSYFLPPSGVQENLTYLTFTDYMGSSQRYALKWSPQSHTLPINQISFDQKFINMTALQGSPVIDSIFFLWDQADVDAGGYNESAFRVWKHNVNWTELSGTLDEFGDYILISNMPVGSQYAILQYNKSPLTECTVIDAPETYKLGANLTGAPNSVIGGSACMVIDSSDVTLDCDGHSISHDGSSGTFGVYVNESLTNVTVKNCEVYNYAYGGISRLSDSHWGANTFNGNTYGLYFLGSGNQMTTGGPTFFYNNSLYDLDISTIGGTGSNFSLLNTFFLPDSGAVENYTQVTFSHTMPGNQRYALSWSPQSHTLPINQISFAQTFLNMTALQGGPSLDYIYFLYEQGDVDTGGYNESAFGVWKHDGSWSELSSTLDTVGDYLLVSNMPVGSQYAILQYNKSPLTECTVIDAPETYKLGANLTGAPNSVIGGSACMVIDSSDVTLDCDGHSISHDGSSGTFGVYVNESLTNVTVKNCEVYNYAYGGISRLSDSHWGANTFNGNTYGLYFLGSGNQMTTGGPTFFYNNSLYDLDISTIGGTGSNFSLLNTFFLPDSGAVENYTQVTFSHTMPGNQRYALSWSPQSHTLPINQISFAQTFLNMTALQGGPSLDYIYFLYEQGDVDTGGYNESAFGVWKHDGSWSELSSTLDTVGDYLLVSNMPVGSQYAILQYNKSPLTECTVIDAPETYKLGANLTGAPNSVIGGSACMVIDSSDVTLDCDGHSISHDGSSGTFGVYVNESLTNVTVKNCEVYNYAYGGISRLSDSHWGANTFNGNTYGLYFLGSGNQMTTGGPTFFYNNSLYDLDISTIGGTGSNFSLLNTFFLPDSGAVENYTQVTFSHTMPGNQRYALSWSPQSHTLPINQISFAQTFLNMTALQGGPSLDYIYFLYEQGDVDTGGYNESAFGVWKHDGSWSELSSTLDTVGDYLLVSNMPVGSQYGILQYSPEEPSYNISSCQEITSNGTYTLTADLTGNLSNGACLKITGDDITIDCDGHSITDDGAAYAIWADSVDNATLLNCVISNYSSGVYLYNVSNSHLANINSSDSGYAFYIDSSSGVKITDSKALHSSMMGIYAKKSSGVHIDPSWFCGAGYGVFVDESNDTLIEDSIACNNTQYGIYVLDSDNTTVLNSRTYNNAQDFQVDNNLGSSVALNISSLVFDRPAGDMSDYTDMSLLDSVSAGGSFSMNWSSGTALPANYTSFENKFVDLTGSESIGTITWTWTAGESAAYNESAFELQKYNGTWNDTGATLNEGANTLTLTSHTPGSIYGIMSNATPLNVTTANVSLYGANVTNVTHHGRFNASAAGNLSTEGGNVSGVNISSTQLTERWAAFYGDVVGNIFLNDVTGTNVYSWSWAPASGGVVCLSTDSALTDPTTVSGALGTDIDIAWSLTSSATDSGNKTFNSTNCTIGIGTETISNASYADTGSAGGFMTCALKSATTPTKPDMLFCSSIISGGTLWNGATGDYEVMVPTPEASGTNETYYFYANLN